MPRRLRKAYIIAAISAGLLVPGIATAGAAPAASPGTTVADAAVGSEGSAAALAVAVEDNGTLNVDFGIETVHHTAGATWYFRVIDNNSVVARGAATTQPDGSLTVSKTIVPNAATNNVIVTARNPLTGEAVRLKATV